MAGEFEKTPHYFLSLSFFLWPNGSSTYVEPHNIKGKTLRGPCFFGQRNQSKGLLGARACKGNCGEERTGERRSSLCTDTNPELTMLEQAQRSMANT